MTFDTAPIRDLYPFESHSIDRGGLRLHYLDEGSGDALVCLHGNPTWSFYYRSMVQTLRGDYRLIVPDHIGCGLSEKPGDGDYDYRLRSRIDDVALLLDHLGIGEKITLVLHDWGGAIGMGFAARHPERIARIVLSNTAAFFPPGDAPIPVSLRLVRDTWLGPLLVRGLNAFALGATRMATHKGLSPEVRRGLTAPYNSWANRIATLRFVQDIPLRPEDPSYDEIVRMSDAVSGFDNLPVLIGWGMKDFVFDLNFFEEWKRRLPSAQVHAFEDAGHYLLEDAGPEWIEKIALFLKANPI